MARRTREVLGKDGRASITFRRWSVTAHWRMSSADPARLAMQRSMEAVSDLDSTGGQCMQMLLRNIQGRDIKGDASERSVGAFGILWWRVLLWFSEQQLICEIISRQCAFPRTRARFVWRRRRQRRFTVTRLRASFRRSFPFCRGCSPVPFGYAVFFFFWRVDYYAKQNQAQ